MDFSNKKQQQRNPAHTQLSFARPLITARAPITELETERLRVVKHRPGIGDAVGLEMDRMVVARRKKLVNRRLKPTNDTTTPKRITNTNLHFQNFGLFQHLVFTSIPLPPQAYTTYRWNHETQHTQQILQGPRHSTSRNSNDTLAWGGL